MSSLGLNSVKESILSAKEKISEVDFSIIKDDISSLKSLALSIAASDFQDKSALFHNSLDLLSHATDTIRKLTNQIDSISETASNSLDLLGSLLVAAKDVVSIVYADNSVEIAKVATELAAKSVTLIDKGLILAGEDNATRHSFSNTVNVSLNNIKDIATKIAEYSESSNKAEIAKSAFDLFSQISDVVTETLQNVNDLGIEPQLLGAVNQFSHSVLSTARTVTDIAAVDPADKAEIAKSSVSLIGNVNDIISDILVVTNKDSALSKAIHDITANKLSDVEESAVNLANADILTQEGKASVAINSLTLISQTNQIIANVLTEIKMSNSKTEFVSELTDVLLNTAKSITLLATSENNSTSNKEQIAIASTSLLSNVNDLMKSLTNFAGKEEVGNALHSAVNNNLEQIKQLALALSTSDVDSSQGKAAIAISSFGLIAQTNNIIGKFLDNAGLSNDVSKSVQSLTHSVLDSAKILTNLVQADLASDNGKEIIANSSLELAKTANDIMATVLKSSGGSNNAVDVVHNSIDTALSGMKDSAVAIALATSTNSNSEIAIRSLDLLTSASDMVKNIASGLHPNQTVIPKTLDLFNSLFSTAQGVVQLVEATSQEDIANASVELVQNANTILKNSLILGNVENDLSKAFYQSISDSVGEIKNIASKLATASSVDDKAMIAKLSFDLIGQVGDIAAKTMTDGKVNVDANTLDSVKNISHSVLDAAKSVTDILVANNPSEIAGLSVSLVSNANDVVSNILTLANKHNSLTTAIHKVTGHHLGHIEKLAVNLANADSSTIDGKVSIALNSLNLIAQGNHLIEEVFKEAKLDGKHSEFAHSLTNLMLDTAKTVTSLVAADSSTVEGKQQVAVSSTRLVGHVNELIKSISTVAKAETKVGNAAYEALKNHLSNVEGIAVKLAAATNDTLEGRTQIALESFNLMSQTNTMITEFLGKVGVKEELTKPVSALANSILDTAKTLTNVVQIDPTTDKGKISIANSSFELAKSANKIVSQIMDLSGASTEFSHKVSDVAHKILTFSQGRLLNIGSSISALANADKLTEEGVKVIVDKSFAITSDVNGLITDIVTAVGKDSSGKASSGLSLSNSIIDLGHSIANLIQADINTSSGKAAIAEGSVKLIGNINGLVSNVLSISKVSSAVSNVITSSAGGVLNSLASLVGSSIKLHDWTKMSQADQVAAGFDVGLKAVGTIATGVGSTAEAISKLIGTTTMLPQIGVGVSGISLAVSPLEIKGLVDEHSHVKEVSSISDTSTAYGYEGDALLASLLNEKFAVNTAYTATDIALNLATTAISVAASASVIGTPIAAIAGVVRGVIGGIMSAVKQPALEYIAQRYIDQIKEYGDIQKYFDQNIEATLDKFYTNSNIVDSFKNLQKLYNVDNIITLDGVASSKTAIELAAITKFADQMTKANNYAQLIREGEIDKELTAQYLSMDAKTGVLEITVPGNSLIKFNSPLFAPGVEESRRKSVGKNNYYTDLIINGPSEHTINDGAGSNIFISNDKYASVLYDKNGQVLKNIHLNINAGDGNDTYVADNGYTTFDGGNGVDSVSYNDEHIRGISIQGKENGTYTVVKSIIDAGVTVENIKVQNHSYGKRQESVEYRELKIETQSYEATDILRNVEVISASDYNDKMFGSNGNDYFLAQKGNDVVYGKDGNDIILGGEGNDQLHGDYGNDTLNGGTGSDFVYGGYGDDTIVQDDAISSDILSGGKGIDTLDLRSLITDFSGAGAIVDLKKQVLSKGTVTDTIYDFENVIGTAGDDIVYGDDKDNILVANDGDDLLYGSGGNDLLVGGNGSNKLYGGAGNDVYLLSTNGINYISDNEGYNLAKLVSNQDNLGISFTKNESNVILTVNNEAENVGTIVIENADKFGVFSIGEGYYLDLVDGHMKYVLSGDSANADLSKNVLNINKGSTLQVFAGALENNITLDAVHQNQVNIMGNTNTYIKGFDVGKDKLQLSLINSGEVNNTELKFSGYDIEGGDVRIESGNTSITLSGAGSLAYADKTLNDLVQLYII